MTDLTWVVWRAIPAGLTALVLAAAVWPQEPDAQHVPPAQAAAPAAIEIAGDAAMEHARAQPAAVVAGELLVPWSTIRSTLAAAASDDASLGLVDDLRGLVEELRRTRRDPSRALPWSQTLAQLETLEATVRASAWSDDARVSAALQHHEVVLRRFAVR